MKERAIIFIITLLVSVPVNGSGPQLGEYLELHNPSENWSSVRLVIHRELLLSDFYENLNVAINILFANSMRINGICNNIDVHFVKHELEVCPEEFPFDDDGRMRCIWNEDNVLSSKELKTRRAFAGSSATIELFKHKFCQKPLFSGKLIVQGKLAPKASSSARPKVVMPPSRSPPNPSKTPSSRPSKQVANKSGTGIGDCISITSLPKSVGKKIVLRLKVWKVLQQHYYGRKQRCGQFVFVTSVSVNGVCGHFNAHVYKLKDYEKCFKLKGVAFRKCFWTFELMTKSMVLNTRSAFKGKSVEVRTFRKAKCVQEWDKGVVTVGWYKIFKNKKFLYV